MPYSLLLFLIGLLYYVHFDFIGTLRVGECILVGLVFLFPHTIKIFYKNKFNKPLFVLLVVNLILIINSNLNNGVWGAALMKGLSNTAFILFCLVGMFALLKKQFDALKYFLGGMFIGSFFSSPYILDLSKGGYDEQYFDIILAPKVLPLLLLLSIYFSRYKNTFFLISLSVGVFALISNARSIGLVLLIASLIYLLLIVSRQKFSKGIYLWGIGMFVVVLAFGYSLSAKMGLLGGLAENQINQKSLTITSLFLGIGRPDPLIAMVAINDKPLWGHGSDNNGLYYIKKTVGLNFLPKVYKDYFGYEKLKIPSHSVILGSVVESGIFSALPWVYVLVLFFYVLFSVQNYKNDKYLYLIVFACVTSFWNIMFSPFGFARFDLPYLWAIVVLCVQKYMN